MEEEHQGFALDPGFQGRSLLARSIFWDSGAAGRQWVLMLPMYVPRFGDFLLRDFLWLDFSQSNIQQKIFSPNMRLVHMSQKEMVAKDTNAKDGASPSERFYSRGCRGNPLRFFPPAFL